MRPTRKSIPLTERDLRNLAMLRRSHHYRAALADLTGTSLSETSSEATLLHAVWNAGVKAVVAQAEEVSYAELAKQQNTAEDKTVARRRQPTWAAVQ